MSRTLFKSHRVAGYEIARTRAADGREYVILQTAPHKEEAALAHMLRPASPDEVAFDVRVLLSEVLTQARFLGLDPATLRQLVDEELEREGE